MDSLTKDGTFQGPGSSTFMTHSVSRLRPVFTYVALAILLAASAVQSAATPTDPATSETAATTPAEQLFAGAPDGVDPVVTGPVSAAFKQRTADAGCDRAVWPNIPVACYPR
jgi:hypothetical protein